MTAKSIILTTIGLIILQSLVKIFFIQFFDLSTWYVVALFLLVTILVTTGIVRRVGVLNHFEVLIALVLWTPLVLLWDFIIIGGYLGYGMYYHLYFWLGYAGMLFAIAVFHKWQPLDKG